jgi:hypothetical protein
MRRDEILAILKANEPDLRARGSRARDSQRPDSDTDIMIETDPEARITVYDYVGLKDHIAALLDGRVDVVDRDSLKPYLRPAVTEDAVYAF